MKTLFRKELREHVKLAVLGLLVFSFLLAHAFHSSSGMGEQLSQQGYYDPDSDKLQPILSTLFLAETGLFCAAFGALLGFLQTFIERQRDLWAFLVHRPVTRSDIFLGKTLAGLGLYALAAGLPPVCSLIYAAIPGHVAAPFEWGMALPATGHFLAATVYYFAGMLTGLRQARWYVSRGLGLGLALLVSFGVKMNEEFGWSLLLMLIGAAVLGTAAWGGFQNSGHYEGQPGPAKGALTLVMTTGAGLAAFALLGLVALLFSMNSFSWSYYSMGRNGTIYKVT